MKEKIYSLKTCPNCGQVISTQNFKKHINSNRCLTNQKRNRMGEYNGESLCEYNCGNKAKYILSNGKHCCSIKYQQCPAIKEKNKIGVNKMHEEGRGYKFTDIDRVKSHEKAISESIKKAFVKNSTYNNAFIKSKFIEFYCDEYKCFECGIKDWNNKPIVLELEHIDGNNRNNMPENLKLLCPNCHSQTDTFRGRNINNGLVKVSDKELIEAIKSTTNTRRALIQVGLTPKGANYERVKRLKDKFKL